MTNIASSLADEYFQSALRRHRILRRCNFVITGQRITEVIKRSAAGHQGLLKRGQRLARVDKKSLVVSFRWATKYFLITARQQLMKQVSLNGNAVHHPLVVCTNHHVKHELPPPGHMKQQTIRLIPASTKSFHLGHVIHAVPMRRHARIHTQHARHGCTAFCTNCQLNRKMPA